MTMRPVHIRWALAAYGGAFFCFLYVPMIVLCLLSFNDSPVVGFPIRTLSTAWYRQALADGVLMDALWNSACLGIASSVLGTGLALTAVLGLRRVPRLAAAA